jgi:hydrogenase maturation protease
LNPSGETGSRATNSRTRCGRVLVIGFGNPGRADDGLGPSLAARIEALRLPDVDVEIDYQLSIEHSEQVARYDRVIFVDADVSAPAPFHLRRISPDSDPSFTSHSVSPAGVLALAQSCFGREPEAWLLGIHPADIETFAEGLTQEGERNQSAALEAMRTLLGYGFGGSA